MTSTTTKRHDLRSLRRLFSRSPHPSATRVPDRTRIPTPASSPMTAPVTDDNETSARCPACELREYLSE